MASANILIVATDCKPRPGGVAEYIHNVATQLQLQGDNVTVFAPCMDNDVASDRQCRYHVERFPPPKLPSSLGERIRTAKTHFNLIYQAIKKTDADCIFFAHYMWLSLHCVVAAKISNVPYFTAAYGLEIGMDSSSPKENFKLKAFFRCATHVICISEFTRRKVLDLGVGRRKAVTLPCGLNRQAFTSDQRCGGIRERYKLERNAKVILTLARLIERKGTDKVIEAMPQVLKAVPEAIYLIGGSGPFEARLKELADERDLGDRVIFAGYIPDAEKADCYNACDLFVMPARELEGGDFEGFGIVYLEANACGKPVIGGRSGGTEDAIIDGETGILVDPLDVDEIARTIVHLLKDESYSRKLGGNGKRRVETDLDGARIVARLRDIVMERT